MCIYQKERGTGNNGHKKEVKEPKLDTEELLNSECPFTANIPRLGKIQRPW